MAQEYCYTTKKEAKVYSVKKKECFSCQIRKDGTSGKKIRRLQHSIYKGEYDRLDKRLKSYVGKRMKRIRQITTEPLFAKAKENHGLSKFMTRGIEKARKNSLLIASVQNLKRLIRSCKRKLPNKMDMQKTLLPLMQYETFSYNSNYCFV